MGKINQGEVDVVLFAGLRQLAELGYHRVRFHQDEHETSYFYIDRLENSEPVWRKVVWKDGQPVLPERKGL